MRIVEGRRGIRHVNLATTAQPNIAANIEHDPFYAGHLTRSFQGAVDNVGFAKSIDVDRTVGPFGAKREGATCLPFQKS
jgi:hypothetical protein